MQRHILQQYRQQHQQQPSKKGNKKYGESNAAASCYPPSSLQGSNSLRSMLKSLSVMDLANVFIVNDNAQLPSNELLTKLSLENRRSTATTIGIGGGFRRSRLHRRCKRDSPPSRPTNNKTRMQEEDDSDYLDSSTETLASVFKEIEDNDFDLSNEDLDPFREVERWGESPRISSSQRKGHGNKRCPDNQDTIMVYPHRCISYPEESPIQATKRSVVVSSSIPPPPPPPSTKEDTLDARINSPTSILDIGKEPR